MATQHHEAPHQPGSMDIRDHERTFEGFVRFVSWGMAIVVVILVFLALVNI